MTVTKTLTLEDRSIERALRRLYLSPVVGLHIKTNGMLGTLQSVTHHTPISGFHIDVTKYKAQIFTFTLGVPGFEISIEGNRMANFLDDLRKCKNSKGFGFSTNARKSARQTQAILMNLVTDIKVHPGEYTIVKSSMGNPRELARSFVSAVKELPSLLRREN